MVKQSPDPHCIPALLCLLLTALLWHSHQKLEALNRHPTSTSGRTASAGSATCADTVSASPVRIAESSSAPR
eukprot:764183-Pyramimonas_sp.AAC.1